MATLKGEDCDIAMLYEFPAFETDPESRLGKGGDRLSEAGADGGALRHGGGGICHGQPKY